MSYITKAEVHDAADRVDADGQRPSPKTVRALLQRGSFTTIDNHLQTWLPRDQRLELPPVPEGLTATVSSVITDLWHISRAAAHAETAAQIEQAHADVAEARAAAQLAGEKADRLADDLSAARKRLAELEQMVAERDQRTEEYADYIRQWEKEDARKTGEIESLQRMVAQFTPAGAGTRKIAKKAAAEQPRPSGDGGTVGAAAAAQTPPEARSS